MAILQCDEHLLISSIKYGPTQVSDFVASEYRTTDSNIRQQIK